jgi:hypothetical protein
LISERPELIEIYLRGAKISSLLNEVVYGTKTVKGAALRVPIKLFDILSTRLTEASPRAARAFLVSRTDAEFRKRHLHIDPSALRDKVVFSNPLLKDIQSEFFLTAEKEGLLSESDREHVIERYRQEIVEYGDVTFLLHEEYVLFLGQAAHSELLDVARTKLAPRFVDLISDAARDCDADDPDGYFEDHSRALAAMENLFPNDTEVASYVEAALGAIEDTVNEVKENSSESPRGSGSVFDDVDT